MQTSQSAEPKSILIKLLTKYHGQIILFFVLPVSFLYDFILGCRNWIFWNFVSNPKLHHTRVKKVQEQVIAWNQSGSTKPMCTARPAWMTMSLRVATFKKDCHRIKINLRDILEIDTQKKTIRVEPLVTMGQITRYLLGMGYALAVMVEMEDLTAGGLAMGVGMETNSHRIGLIQENIVAYELVLGDGTLIHATSTENEDLFYALPWSHGTLGFLVAIELKIIPVKSHMHLTYTPCYSLDEMCQLAESSAVSDDGPDFLEVIIFSKEKSVLISGNFADVKTPKEKTKVNQLNFWFKPWFYKQVEEFLKRGKDDEYIPLRHYYHRYTRSIFWELESLIPFGNHPVYRWLFGWLGPPKVSFLKLVGTPELRRETVEKHVVQDFILPISELKRSVLLADELFTIYPLLVYFMRISATQYQGFLRKPEKMLLEHNYGMYFDLGIYGIPAAVKNNQPWDAKSTIRKAEQYVREAKGYQCLYADIFATREEFEQMFDHTLYKKMRIKYKAENAFPYVYDKVRGQW
ncbi:MAG: hypothetical protein A3F11_06105 [Gammaproteobacteria bacterium RIFCSPHIGHO2_12_FULL_37_14]|nr:MAG: hypothetical protein A3F11_06105 [Gammaproteobacteria bacterium RIFCSPHIGHO2_12_FULL_37_14]